MSLATRCPACGTIFRVVQDQLKVSEGWVRCGQCHEVFHGIEALFDLDSDPAVAARRAAARVPAAPPPTRVFADQRASAPIPMPTPAAPVPVTAPSPIAIPARPPAPPAQPPMTPAPQSVRATPSAFGASDYPPPAPATRPGYTGFTPATRPMPPPPTPAAPLPPPPAPLPAPPAPLPPPPAPPPRPAAALPPPAPTPLAPVATRGTIAPRFAARLAEEAARAQAVTPSPIPSAYLPPVTPAQAPAPFGSALTQHTTPDLPSPAESTPVPDFFAPTAPLPLDPLPPPPPAFAPVSVPMAAPTPAPAPIVVVPEYIPPSIAARRAPAFAPPPVVVAPATAPTPEPAPVPAPVPVPAPARAEMPLVTPIPVPSPPPLAEAAPSASDLTSALAASAPEGPFTPADAPAPAPALAREPAPDVGGSTMPSLLADDAADEPRAGPPTLASMLPDDAGDWPPKRARKRPANATAPTTELEVVDKTKDPRFLREAKAGARWRKPWVRAVLSVTLLLLIVAAVGQVAWPQRDTLASRWPVTRPAWDWLCEQADCRIEAPRAIASLALDGSSLTRTDTEHVLLFSADLHNRADHEVRMPSFDLTFMDLNGEIVARKVLSPEQIGIKLAALPAEGELHVHARLQVGSLPASGFQADLFYP